MPSTLAQQGSGERAKFTVWVGPPPIGSRAAAPATTGTGLLLSREDLVLCLRLGSGLNASPTKHVELREQLNNEENGGSACCVFF